MDYQIKQTRDFLVLSPSGRLTSEDHRNFVEIIHQIGSAGDRHVIFDAIDVEYVDSTGIGMLIVAKETALRNGGRFRVRNACNQFKELAERIHADHIMWID